MSNCEKDMVPEILVPWLFNYHVPLHSQRCLHLSLDSYFGSWRRYKALKDMKQQIADRDEDLIEFANAYGTNTPIY